MKRSRSDIPTGASLFRELKLKRQRLSMLLNRDINDVLSSTSSSDTGDHGSDIDAGPPLMLREDSACFESRRHDAVDSGASSDGDWSFCGYSTRHPPMLISDHSRLLSTHASHSGLFNGHPPGGDRKTFAAGKPEVDAKADSMTTHASSHGVAFWKTNIPASVTRPSVCATAYDSPSVVSDRCSSLLQTDNTASLSKLSSGATVHIQESDHIQKVTVNDQVQTHDWSTEEYCSPAISQSIANPSVASSVRSGTLPMTSDDPSSVHPDNVHGNRSVCLETRSVIQCGGDLMVSVKVEDPHITCGALMRGDEPVLDWRQLEQLKQTQETSYNAMKPDKVDPNKQQLICEICTDRASGLHYGIISCEGCKGFFKRTVQNKRVYSCIAEGNCQVTKLRRNRCQYCRFKKCLLKGMVLAAVRDDRMPGGRNSGAVYSLYKVKYRKPGRNVDNTRRTAGPRRLKSVAGGDSSNSSNKRQLGQSDSTGQTFWMQPDLAQSDSQTDNCLCQAQQSAAFCTQLQDSVSQKRNMSADSVTLSQKRNMSADSITLSQDRNMTADNVTVSQDRNGNGDSITVSHNRSMNADSITVSGGMSMTAGHPKGRHDTAGHPKGRHDTAGLRHDPHVNADNPNVSHYSNMNVDNSSACYNRDIHADSPTVGRYLNADSPTVSRYLNADSPTVSRYLNADSPTVSRYMSADCVNVVSGSVRYADSADMNRSRRSVIADSRDISERRSGVNYDRVNVVDCNAGYGGDSADSRHSNHNMDTEPRSHLVHIEQLLRCEHAHDLAAATQPYSGAALTTLLRHLSDNVVRELVKWMKTLPFYDRLPMGVHRQCLAEKWYDLLLLTMLAHQAATAQPSDGSPNDVNSHVARNVTRLQLGLRHVLEHEMPVDQLYREVGDIVQKLTDIVLNFRKLGLTREEFVCLKVILLLSHESAAEANETAEHIQGIYRDVLWQLVSETFPHESTRFTELLLQLPHIQTASALLMKTNTIYIPSMLNAPLE